MFGRRTRGQRIEAIRTYQQSMLENGRPPIDSYRSPIRPPGFISDYIVPIIHAVSWGVILASLIVILKNHYGDPKSGLGTIWLEYFLGVTALAYVLTSTATWNLLWAALEIALDLDLDKSGKVGDRPIIVKGRQEPSQRQIASRALAPDDDGPGEDEEGDDQAISNLVGRIAIDYPFRAKETTIQWFVRVSSDPNVGTSSRAWEPILGRKRYQDYRDGLISAGWARWNAYDQAEKPLVNRGWSFEKPWDEICKHIK